MPGTEDADVIAFDQKRYVVLVEGVADRFSLEPGVKAGNLNKLIIYGIIKRCDDQFISALRTIGVFGTTFTSTGRTKHRN